MLPPPKSRLSATLMFRSKYGSKWTDYKGIKYASKREAGYAAELDLLIKSTLIRSWRRQIPFRLFVNHVKITKYVIDFEVQLNDGTIEYHEVKGHPTPEWKIKHALFKALYPNHVIKVIR